MLIRARVSQDYRQTTNAGNEVIARTPLVPFVQGLTLSIAVGLGCLTAWLTWASLGWPILTDAGLFHFIGGEMLLGEVPYRDLFDMNMPFTFVLHALVIAVGGTGDWAFRLYDLGTLASVGVLAAALVWPAGRLLAAFAALSIMCAHLMFGPGAAGERDYVMLVPALGAALLSAYAGEHPTKGRLLLVAVGVASGLAALIKPTGVLLAFLPMLAGRFGWRDAVCVGVGGLAVALTALAGLAATGALGPFYTAMTVGMPIYTSIAHHSIGALLFALGWAFLLKGVRWGFAAAALIGLRGPQPPRARVMMGLTVFGVIHFLFQQKGFWYHIYPLMAGVCCWGAWSIRQIPPLAALAVVTLIGASFTSRAINVVYLARTLDFNNLVAAQATDVIETSLTSRLRPGARVELLDTGSPASLAMVRAGMRQATPHFQWFFLLLGPDVWRRDFIAALKANPPDAVLVTDWQWPLQDGFQALDDWPQLSAQLACCYRLAQSRTMNGANHGWIGWSSLSWRLYLRRGN
jgi:hypothetical protein